MIDYTEERQLYELVNFCNYYTIHALHILIPDLLCTMYIVDHKYVHCTYMWNVFIHVSWYMYQEVKYSQKYTIMVKLSNIYSVYCIRIMYIIDLQFITYLGYILYKLINILYKLGYKLEIYYKYIQNLSYKHI